MITKNQNLILPEEIIQEQSKHSLLKSLHLHRVGAYSNQNKVVRVRPTGFKTAHILNYCVEGEGWFKSQGQTWRIQKGDVFFSIKNVENSYGPAKENSWQGYGVYFAGYEADDYLRWLDVKAEKPVLHIGTQRQVIKLFEIILQQCQLGYSLNYLISSAALLRQLLSQLKLVQQGVGTADSKLDSEVSIQFMLEHISEKITVEQLASMANVSTAHFSRLFQKHTGYAPIDYFIRLKMQQASDLLATTDIKIIDIAYSLGYNDPYYFSRSFKQVLGMSPKAYRKRNQFAF